jgi:choline dehydrogenase-like flavoprotein
MAQVAHSSPVVIGSGASRGTVTKVLADPGISVLLLEAGPMLSRAKDFRERM